MKQLKLTIISICLTTFSFSPIIGLAQELATKKDELPGTSDQQTIELQAIAFVKQHHPELSSLLELLKSSDIAKYNSAIKDVSKVIRRLEGTRKRDEKLYQIEIDGWKIQSHIDLMLARGLAKDNAFDESDVRDLIEKRMDNQIQRTKREIELIDERRVVLTDNVEKLMNNRQAQIDKQHANMLKRMRNEKSKARTPEPK